MTKKHKPVVMILDDNPERCIRQEAALTAALAEKKIYAAGSSHYGGGYIARAGMENSLPAIEIDGLYYIPPQRDKELDYETICRFLDTMLSKGVLTT